MTKETGLALPEGSPNAKTIAILRKLTPLSIAEIRQRAAEGVPITEFNALDEYGIRGDEVLLRSVRDARELLLAVGVDARVVVDDQEEGSNYLDNVIQSMRKIAEQLAWEDEISLAQEEVDRAVTELSEEYEDFCWWVPDDTFALGEELRRELPEDHPLEGRELVTLARSERRDDVLFYDGENWLVVHLTWGSHNNLPFPTFRVVEGDVTSFLRSDYLEDAEHWHEQA